MAYYWAIKENKLLIHALTWINLKIIILSEGTQAKKGKKKKRKKKNYWCIILCTYTFLGNAN